MECSTLIDRYLKPTIPAIEGSHKDIKFGELKWRYDTALDALLECNQDKKSIIKIKNPGDK